MAKEHLYTATVTWTGNQGDGTSDYKAFTRDYDIICAGKPIVKGSADPGYLGDATRYNPEDMLLAALSACHMLWYLHLCTVSKVVVTAYQDAVEGTMLTNQDGSGEFTSVTLKPRITITSDSDAAIADSLHDKANAMCFIARSVNFPVQHESEITSL
jgi:organic hydroperoxide reductase OsmC/OhrA